jgi:hypothetical protein
MVIATAGNNANPVSRALKPRWCWKYRLAVNTIP